MARTVDRLERISEDFDRMESVDPMAKADLLAELFTRLDSTQAAHAMTLMSFWCKQQARAAGNGVEVTHE